MSVGDEQVGVGVVVGIERGHAPRPTGVGDSITHRALFKFLVATEVEPVAKRQVIEPVEVMTMRGRLQVHGEHLLGCPRVHANHDHVQFSVAS